MSAPTRVCSVTDLDTDALWPTEVGGEDVVLVRTADGVVHAVADLCSHAHVKLSEGEVEDGAVECWLHGARFDLATGRPLNLPATEPVAVHTVTIEGDDVLVSLTEED